MPADLDSFASIPAAFFSMATQHPEATIYEQAELVDGIDGERKWRSCTNAECARRVSRIAGYLQQKGVGAGTSVAIVSQSRPEWMEADLAILSLGGVSVSVYQTLPTEDIAYILHDSQAKIVFAENSEQVEKLRIMEHQEIDIPATEDRGGTRTKVALELIVSFEEVLDDEVLSFTDIVTKEADFSHDSFAAITRDDLATLVYTSGTTGPPKGVMQTHGNHLANCRQAWNANLLQQESSILVFLPLAHSFAKLMGYLGFISESSLKFPSIPDRQSSKLNPTVITRDIQEANCNIVPIVPRLLEKMQEGIVATSNAGGLKAALLSAALWAAQEVAIARNSGKKASLLAEIVYGGTSGVRQVIREKLFGKSFSYAISGGAKLSPATARFFDALGIEVLEGYGLTETCVATNVNRLGLKKIGTVGPVLDSDIELRIAEDGEILFRGPNIALGYHQRKIATAESWDVDGWFHTGDLGAVDDDGFLSIVGRKKGIIVTSYGKNIAPEEIEAAVKATPLVSQAVMIGDGRPYCIVLVTLDSAAVAAWLAKRSLSIPVAQAHAAPELQAAVWQAIETVNQHLAHHETMKKVIVAEEDFTVENGMLTPTFKVKQRVVLQKYEALIEASYDS